MLRIKFAQLAHHSALPRENTPIHTPPGAAGPREQAPDSGGWGSAPLTTGSGLPVPPPLRPGGMFQAGDHCSLFS